MKISYAFFKDFPATRILINKLMNGSYPNVKSSFKVKKLVDSLSSEFEIYKSILIEKEKIIEIEDGKVVNSKKIQEVFKELYSHEFEVDLARLSFEDIEGLKDISPRELELLQFISEPNVFDSLV